LATPTPTLTPTLSPIEQGLYPTYAHGELLPYMQVPVQRSASGEGGWYVIIGSEEGWAQFLAQMGQPTGIWGPVQWEDEILVGALLGVRQGRGHEVTIRELDLDGVTAVAEVDISTPTPEQAASTWVTYPFHLIRVPRSELALGTVTFRFERAWQTLAERDVNMIDLDIAWLSGEAATYPTPTPIPTLPPEPTASPTPVPHLQVTGTVLEVMTDTLSLRIVPYQSEWQKVELMEGTSIFREGQPATLAELVPGTAVAVLGYPGAEGTEQEPTMRAAHIDLLRPAAETDEFARYKPRSVSLSTIYDGYRLPLDARAISTPVSFTGPVSTTGPVVPLSETFSVTQTTVLTRNGFVIVPAAYPSFASLYNDPAAASYPLYVSADSVLHASRLAFGRVQRAVERQQLLPELEMLDLEMYELSWAQFEATRALATPSEQRLANTSLHNAAYFAVAASLLDPTFTPPEVLSPVVSAELALISAGQAITVSPLMDLPGVPDGEKLRVDYSRFVPTGTYARDEVLARYYRAMTWHRAIAYRSDQRAETRAAAAIAYTLQAHSTPRVLWQRIHAVLAFLEGQDASYTPPEYAGLLAQVLEDTGAPAGELVALADERRMDVFIEGIDSLPLPDNPIWTIWAAKEPIERDWRFFGLPFQVEEYVFGQTTGDAVGSPGVERPLPSGIDLAAVLGSLEAYRVAAEVGYTGYMNYVDQVDTVRNELSAIPVEHWTSEQHWNWLYVYRSLLEEKNASYPSWMNTTAWKRRTLQAKLGGWTHVHHNAGADLASIPAKDADAPAVEALDTPEPETPEATSWGYAEPQPVVYARLAALTRLVVDGLESRLMLPAPEREMLLELEAWLMFLQDTARRELTTQTLTDEEYTRLGEYGAFVNHLTQTSVADLGTIPDPADDLTTGPGYSEAVAVPLVTAADTQLVEATGPVDEIYVVVERGRRPVLARGGVYAQYEFPWPATDPMTDARWSVLLTGGQGPARPSWLAGVVIEP
jgi:hypothetical protein